MRSEVSGACCGLRFLLEALWRICRVYIYLHLRAELLQLAGVVTRDVAVRGPGARLAWAGRQDIPGRVYSGQPILGNHIVPTTTANHILTQKVRTRPEGRRGGRWGAGRGALARATCTTPPPLARPPLGLLRGRLNIRRRRLRGRRHRLGRRLGRGRVPLRLGVAALEVGLLDVLAHLVRDGARVRVGFGFGFGFGLRVKG